MVHIAVIGGGAAGLAAASYLIEEEDVHVTLYKERSQLGGVWTGEPTRTRLNPMYEGLQTNVPHTMMTFTDYPWPNDTPLFPSQKQVRTYLRTYADEKLVNSPRLSFHLDTRVEQLSEVVEGWRIRTMNMILNLETVYGGVVIAAGNYDDRYMTDDEPGRSEWVQAGGLVLHSQSFQNAEAFTGRRVLIVGNGPSGWDITERVARFADEVVVSVRNPPVRVVTGAHRVVGLIQQYDYETNTTHFHEGTAMRDVDVVIYCTGYQYNFPFAMNRRGGTLFPPGFRVSNLYQHIFYIPDPTLAFVGLPKMTASFTVAEAQSAVIARVFSERLPLPTARIMSRWTRRHSVLHRQSMQPEAAFHTLSTREHRDKAYVNELHLLASPEGIDFDIGKRPPYWCDCLDSAKEPVGRLRAAFKALGEDNVRCTRYSILGEVLATRCRRVRVDRPITSYRSCFLNPATQ